MVGPVVHGLAKIEEQTQNFSQYRWYVECVCGFQSRLGTESAVKSQFDNHLKQHGCEPYFSNLVEPVEEQTKVSDTKPTGQQGQDVSVPWKPVGAK